MIPKIYVTSPNYSKFDPSIKKKIIDKHWEIFFNPYERLLSSEEVYEWAKDADAIIASTEKLDILVEKSLNLKLIAKSGVGVDNVPIDLCRIKNIAVTYTPHAGTSSAAELTIALILAILRRIYEANNNMHQSKWSRLLGSQISEVSIGIIGWGRIGQKLTHLLKAFKPLSILVNDIVDCKSKIKTLQDQNLNIRQTKLEELLCNSDIITLHADLNPSSTFLIDEKTLKLVKPSAFLVNVARGRLVNEADFIQALQSKRIAGGAFDVFEEEPYTGKLNEFDQMILTSHMGSFTRTARYLMDYEATMSIIKFFSGKKLDNIVPI